MQLLQGANRVVSVGIREIIEISIQWWRQNSLLGRKTRLIPSLTLDKSLNLLGSRTFRMQLPFFLLFITLPLRCLPAPSYPSWD